MTWAGWVFVALTVTALLLAGWSWCAAASYADDRQKEKGPQP
jgi:hypothetical protein